MAELHETHRWGERSYYGEMVPACLDCHAFGFEDVPAAFAECPGPPEQPAKRGKSKEPKSACSVTLESLDDPGHLHECLGGCDGELHFCKTSFCRRWFGVKKR
jgi:hypothetical protein